MGILETTISALIVAGVSGLTFVAYKHPKAYERCYVWLLVLSCAVWVCLMAYSLGYEVASAAARQFVPPDKATALETGLTRYHLSFIWPMIGGFASCVYLTFLSMLSSILKHDVPKPKI